MPNYGVHKLEVTDTSGFKYELGPPFTANIDKSIKRVVVEFSTDDITTRRPVGFIGKTTAEGIVSIGMIFMDAGCRPLGGGFILPEND